MKIFCPDTQETISFNTYMKSKHWALKKETFRLSAYFNGSCHKCKKLKSGINIYHLNYDSLGNEELFDLTALCPKCYRIFYRKM